MNILILDIETAPNKVYTWGLFNQNVAINQIDEPGYVLSWAAKWLGSKEIKFNSLFKSGKEDMLAEIHELMEQADAIIHYNGTKFDIPTLNKEFLELGMAPPMPFKQIDLYRTVRSQFRFPSNKLAYVAKTLGLKSQKVAHGGHSLWRGCMNGEKKSWAVMEKYNKGDVRVTEELYRRILPWIKGHPNVSVFRNDLVCPVCGSKHYHRAGTQTTQSGVYNRFRCKSCKKTFQDNKNQQTGYKYKEIR